MAKILLTEDDEAVRSFVARALAMDGHDIVEAHDGEDGFDRLQEASGAFDLLLTDIKMPFMDGLSRCPIEKLNLCFGVSRINIPSSPVETVWK